MKYIADLSYTELGQAVKSLVLLGEKHITVEADKKEKGRFAITTKASTDTTRSISRKGRVVNA